MRFRERFLQSTCILVISVGLILTSLKAQSQCTVEAFADPISIVCGESVQLTATGNSGNLALDNDFNLGTPGTGWSATSAATYTNPCGPSIDGTTYLWMGDATPQPRTLTTVALDLSPGGQICFDLRFSAQGDAAPCEGPDEPDEGVFLQYSTDGGNTWITINYFDPLGGNDPTLTTWNTYCFPIPPGAETSNTLIRWFQDATSGAEYDHWGIDNVQIILNDPTYYYIWPTNNNFQGQTPPPVSPTVTTTYTVVYTNGTTDACTSNVVVNVNLPIISADAGPDQTICPGDCATLNAQAEVITHPTQQVTYTNNESQDISNVGGLSTDININVQGLNNPTINPTTIESVCVNIEAAPIFGNVSNFTLDLECPGGTSITLVPANVTTGSNYTNTCFVPAGGTNIASGASPYTGNYNPSQPFANLNGCPTNGLWVIGVSTGFGLGTFTGWSITFNDPEVAGPANFTWSPTTGLSDPNSLTPDACPAQTTTYTLTVEDQNQCAQETSSVTVTVQPNCCQLAIDNVAFTNPSCGNGDGTIDITASGGVAPVTYSIDGGFTSQTGSGSFVLIQAGIYYIEVEDANGCLAYDTITLVNPSAPTIDNIQTVPPTCGAQDGSITITASGGTAPVQYSIDNGATFQASNVFNGLAGGTYDIIVEDANGCQAVTQNGLATANAPVIDNIGTVQPSCGVQDGVLNIAASGGVAPLQYSIDNGATFVANNVFTNLGSGTYLVVVEDANGCQVTGQQNLTNSNGPSIDAVTPTPPTCGASDGIIDITASGGTAPLQYSIDNGVTFQAAGLFNGLPSGTYDIVVEDNTGCQATDQVVFPGGTPPTIDAVVPTDPVCGNPDGSIVITASGGTAPLQYSIDNGATFQATGTFNNLNGGNYDIVVEDDAGCVVTGQQTLATSSAPVIDMVVPVQPSCGNDDGGIGIQASGGAAPLQYSIDGGATFQALQAFANLAVGNYNIVVEDANGCQATAQESLANANGPTISSSPATATTCGQDDGTITITATGGLAPLQYSIDNGATYQATGSFTSLPSGQYNIVVVDDNGCQATGQANIAASTEPVIDDVTTVNSTCGAGDGSLTVTASSGTAPLQYSINGGASFQASGTFNNLSAGNYNVVVEDATGCQVAEAAVVNNSNGPSITDVSFVDPVCDIANGSISITASGGVSPLNYSVDNGINFQPGSQFANLAEGVYTVVVEDGTGCRVTQDVTLTNTPAPNIDDLVAVDATCGENNASLSIIASGGTAPLQYSIDGGLTYTDSITHDSLSPATYSVFVIDANGCEASEDITFTPSYLPKAEFTYVPVSTTIYEPEITFSNQSSGASTYQWVFDELGGSSEEHPVFEFPDTEPGTYKVCLIAFNDDECTDTVCKVVRIEEGFTVYVPSAFTPNGNRINDGFFPKTTGVKDYVLYVFDRWGGLMFSSNSDQYPWDGKTRDGEFVAEGVYLWKFVIKDEKHGEHEYVGHVTLIK